MGNYNLKTSILRCENCYSIRKMTISPNYPNVFVNLDCKCNNSRVTIQNFLAELKKGSPFKISCQICKKEDKNSIYCQEYSHIYCHSCMKDHKKHNHIPLSKRDYYCVFHQKELFYAYCYDCSLNFCKKCYHEKRHLNHKCSEFSKLTMSKNDRNYLKEKFTLAENKLEFTTQFTNAFAKKLKKEEEKNIILNAEKKNLSQNRSILELINFFIYFYDNTKYKNYNIIYNFTENINLNVNKFKFSHNNVPLEEALKEILNYLRDDYIIIRTDKINYEKDKKETERNESIWEIDKYDIETRQTLIGPRPFDGFGLNLNDNYDKMNEYERNEVNGINDRRDKNIKITNSINTNLDINNNRNDYYRPRSHAIFIPKKIIQKQMKQKSISDFSEDIETIDGNEEENPNINEEENININEEENLNINEEQNLNINKEKYNKDEENIEENLKINEEKRNSNVIKIKENIVEKNNEEVKKEKEIKEEKVIKEIAGEKKMEEIKDNKYMKFIGINRQRNKTNSLINRMMINGFKNEKIYNINLN